MVGEKKPRKENEWSKTEKIGICGIIVTVYMLTIAVAWGWMENSATLSQKYVCPCFNYYLNESTGFYEAVRVTSCQCLNVDIEDVKACSPLSDTECRKVSNDKLVCDILIMENR
jgi:hypothetical protein